jgi:hypothetical protein
MPTLTPHPALLKPAKDARNTYGDVLRFITGGLWIDNEHWLHADGDQSAQVIAKPIAEASTQSIIHPVSFIAHSQAGPRKTPWLALWKFFARQDITGESHIILEGVDAEPWQGRTAAAIIQTMPFNRRADCNAKANSWFKAGKRVGAISAETQDRGSPSLNTTPWSLAQFEALVGLCTCLCIVYGMSCTEPTSWDDSGLGHHNRFKEWSIYVGKSCPGPARIRQMPELRRRVAENLAAFMDATDWKCGQGGVR